MKNIYRKQNNSLFNRKLEEKFDINEINISNKNSIKEAKSSNNKFNSKDNSIKINIYEENKHYKKKLSDEEIFKPIVISMSLLQVKIFNLNLDLFTLSNNTIPNDINLNITILFHIIETSANPEEINQMNVILEKKDSINDNNYEISNFNPIDYQFSNFLSNFDIDEILIEVTNIEILKEENNYNELYELKVNLGNYTNTSNQLDIDYKSIVEQEFYEINIYEIQKVSSCSQEYKFNLTLDKNIEEDEEKINITFHGKNNKKSYILNSIYTLSYIYNNIVFCEAQQETPDLNYTMLSYLFINETKILSISPKDELIFIYIVMKILQ